jgi:hypothetical protein
VLDLVLAQKVVEVKVATNKMVMNMQAITGRYEA